MSVPDELYDAGKLLVRRIKAGDDARETEIAARHVLAAIRILSDSAEVYKLTTERLERPFGQLANPPCDACGTREYVAEDMFTFRPDRLRYVCPSCAHAGYLQAVSS